MATSCGSCMEPPSSPMKHGAILLAQLAGNHARRAETPLTRSTPLLRREWGWLVTTTFTGPLGARSRFTSALSVAAPISSERIGRNQYVAYRRHSVSGVARDSARRVSEQMYCASFSAKPEREVAGCVRKYFFYCIDRIPQPQFSCNRHEEASKLVLYGRQRDGKFSLQPQVFIMVASLSAAPAISISVGGGKGGKVS